MYFHFNGFFSQVVGILNLVLAYLIKVPLGFALLSNVNLKESEIPCEAKPSVFEDFGRVVETELPDQAHSIHRNPGKRLTYYKLFPKK